MTGEILVNESRLRTPRSLDPQLIEKSGNHGLSWEWTISSDFAPFGAGKNLEKCVYVSWKFEWDEQALKSQGFDGYTGEMCTFYEKENAKGSKKFIPIRFDVKLTHSGQVIRKMIGSVVETRYKEADGDKRHLKFTYWLKKVQKATESGQVGGGCTNCQAKNHAVIVVDGVKIGVDKNNLSMHSEFFANLFKLPHNEFTIIDVKLQDFQHLLNLLDPTNPTFPTDENSQSLLELADRFLIPAAIKIVENHLLKASELPFVKLLELADQFKMESLLEFCLKRVIDVEHVKYLSKIEKESKFSESLKSRLFEKFSEILRQFDV